MIVVERPRDAVDAGTTLQASTCRPRDPRVTGSHRLALRERLSPTSSLWRSLWSEERSKGKPSCERYPEVQTCPAVYSRATNFYSSQELHLALGRAGPEEQGSSKSISIDPYWENLQIKYLWEDFNSITEDRITLKKVIANRKKKEKITTKDSYGYYGTSYVDSKPVLCEHVENLELIHKSLEEHIENELEKWANENDFPDPKIVPRKYNLKKQYVPTFDELWINRIPFSCVY
ncbi:hypothetical protein PGT21_015502 [Puccinia graminis f. sp. tritici]|uniref:Uncharacterized protein n=1 Tax=Puccinia graminis f. sp. tritici TaxID=56615 RepID=A0A5B0MKN7_PUCGR|nr:hypothetical protein PGT21_015502 [Puccinia graminis f. sp. tritici]